MLAQFVLSYHLIEKVEKDWTIDPDLPAEFYCNQDHTEIDYYIDVHLEI